MVCRLCLRLWTAGNSPKTSKSHTVTVLVVAFFFYVDNCYVCFPRFRWTEINDPQRETLKTKTLELIDQVAENLSVMVFVPTCLKVKLKALSLCLCLCLCVSVSVPLSVSVKCHQSVSKCRMSVCMIYVSVPHAVSVTLSVCLQM